jgi:hypothetical protein
MQTLARLRINLRVPRHIGCQCRAFCFTSLYIQADSRLVDVTAGGDFLGLCDQKSSYKRMSDFGRLRNYDRLKLRAEGNDCWQ